MKAALDHIVLAVRDVDASLRFYIDVLGLEPYRVDAFRRGEVIFPSVRINAETIVDVLPPALWSAGEPEPATHHNMNHFCIAVDAVEWPALERRLAAGGIAIELGPMTLSGARGDAQAVYLRDPDGNRVELRYYD